MKAKASRKCDPKCGECKKFHFYVEDEIDGDGFCNAPLPSWVNRELRSLDGGELSSNRSAKSCVLFERGKAS
jgi:hypothetical protein